MIFFNSTRRQCPQCKKLVTRKWYNSHLKKHKNPTRDINQGRHHHSVVIDKRHGIFAAPKNISGPFVQIHVKKVTAGDNAGVFCTNQQCINTQQAAIRGNNLSFECCHAQSISYAVKE